MVIHLILLLSGAKEVNEHDDIFILLAPQNAVGNCIIDVTYLALSYFQFSVSFSFYLLIPVTIST